MPNNNSNEFASATQMNENPVQPNKAFCKYCGNEIKNGSAFCPSCGKPQGNVPMQQPQQPIMQQPHYSQPVQQPYMAGGYQQPQSAMAANTANTSTHNTSTTVVVQGGGGSNGFGTAGFIFALLAFFVCWVPVVDFIVWFLGALFSFIGLFKKPRGLAIAGFILSSIVIIVIVTVVGSIAAIFSR